MPYLIDGHNLIPKIPGLSLRSIDDELQLVNLLQDFCRQQQKNAEVFFDNAPVGYAKTQKFGKVKAHFVRRGLTADSALIKRLKQLRGEARNWVVVSSDHAIQAAARQARAQVLPSEVFARLIQQQTEMKSGDATKKLEGVDDDINEWLKLFGEE